MARGGYVSWNQCTTLRTVFAEPRAVQPQTVSARRRRSLHRGALRFVRDVCSDGRRFHRVLLFALTVADLDASEAQGAIREVFHHYRKSGPGRRYLWWAEFQKRGAIHYHGMLVDPPWKFERDARAWFDAHWTLDRIQVWVEWRSAAWFRSSAGAYALKDVRKVGGKTYEQQYELMPPKWKTYSCHRLAFPAFEHARHENKAYLGWLPSNDQVVIEAVDEHVSATGGCRLRRSRREQLRRRTLKAGSRGRRLKSAAAAVDTRGYDRSVGGRGRETGPPSLRRGGRPAAAGRRLGPTENTS